MIVAKLLSCTAAGGLKDHRRVACVCFVLPNRVCTVSTLISGLEAKFIELVPSLTVLIAAQALQLINGMAPQFRSLIIANRPEDCQYSRCAVDFRGLTAYLPRNPGLCCLEPD